VIGLAHAVTKDRRYRYYVSTVLIAEAGKDRTQSWRLPAQEIEDAVMRVLADRALERYPAAEEVSQLTHRWRKDRFELAVPPRRKRLWGATPGKHCRLGPEPVSGSAFRG
jgi:hypothetical protein